MRKKFLAMYALAGALVASPIFTSCIDEGEESASVTAARDAKSAQIKAKAEYEKQMNELNLALKQLELEAEQANTEKVKHEVEAAIAEAKYETAYFTQQMYYYQDAILTELTGNYTGALYNIADYNQQILQQKANLAGMEANLISAQAYTKEQTLKINNDIAAKKAAIELLKNTDANDKDALNAQLAELENKKDAAENAYNTLQSKYGSTDANRHHWPVEPWNFGDFYDNNPTKLATIEAARELHKLAANLNYQNGATNPDTHPNNVTTGEDSYELVSEDANGYLILIEADLLKYQEESNTANSDHWGKILTEESAELGTEADKKDATYYNESSATYEATLYAQLADAQEKYTTAEKAYNEKNDALAKAKKAAADAATALATEQAKETPDAAKVAELDAAKTTADQAVSDANTAFTQAIKDAYTDAKAVLYGGDKADGTNVAVGAEMAVANAKDYIVKVEGYLADAKEAEENFDKWVAAFSGEDYDAYKAAVDELKAADEAQKLANTEYTEISTLIRNLNGYSAETIAETIAEYETDLAELEASLVNINEYDNIHNSEAYREAAIAYAKEYIVYLEAKLAAEEIRAEHAKAAMDAYLGTSDDTTTEEAA